MTLQINNWDKWQSYRKDRGTPPWIKVYRNLLSNPEWAVLSDSEKGQLISIWILAADKGGVISENPVLIQKMCMLDAAPDVNRFVTLGFLTPACQPDDNQVVTSCPQHDAPETETETDKSKAKRFTKPSKDEIHEYMKQRDNHDYAEVERYFDYNESKGWKVGNTGMKDWKASVRTWLSNAKKFSNNNNQTVTRIPGR